MMACWLSRVSGVCLDTHELLGCVLEACDLAEEHWVLGNVPLCPNAPFLRS